MIETRMTPITRMTRIWDEGCGMRDTGYGIQDTGYGIRDTRYRIQDDRNTDDMDYADDTNLGYLRIEY